MPPLEKASTADFRVALAMLDVRVGMKIRAAARKHGIDRQKLSRRLNWVPPETSKSGQIRACGQPRRALCCATLDSSKT